MADVLDHEYLKSILDYDLNSGIFTWKIAKQKIRVGVEAGSFDKDGYIVIHINFKLYKAHRLAWFYVTGKWPENQIDHKDLNKSNNAFENLREATNSQNKMNLGLQANNSSGYKGVSLKKNTGKWQANIKLNGVKKHLGYFANIEDAAKAYENAIAEYHGSFGRSA